MDFGQNRCWSRPLLCWLLKGGLEVSSGTVKCKRSSYGNDVDNPEIARPVWSEEGVI